MELRFVEESRAGKKFNYPRSEVSGVFVRRLRNSSINSFGSVCGISLHFLIRIEK